MKKFDINDLATKNIEELLDVMLEKIHGSDGKWHCDWSRFNANNFRNYVSNKSYSGGYNFFLLFTNQAIKPEILGEKTSGYYITQKQAFDLGWKLKPECKTWTADNKVREENYQKLLADYRKFLTNYYTLSMEEKEQLEEEKNAKKKELDNLLLEIKQHQIWQNIVFFTPLWFRYHTEGGKYYYQTVEVDKNYEFVSVKSQKEITKAEYDKVLNPEEVLVSFASRYYSVANIEYYVRNQRLENRDMTEPQVYDWNKENYETSPLYMALQNYVKRENIEVKYEKQSEAFYSLKNDDITLPLPEQFETPEGFLATYAHEVTHSTGAKKRLRRFTNFVEGKEAYSIEEVIAETGSFFLQMKYGTLTDELAANTFAYLKTYLSRCKEHNEKSNMLYGINQASKAQDFIVA